MGDYSIGQSVSRFEDPRLLRGGGRYVDDVALPQHGPIALVLRSPHAHARIRSIDTRRGRGRRRACSHVLTGKEWFASGFETTCRAARGLNSSDGSPHVRAALPSAGAETT